MKNLLSALATTLTLVSCQPLMADTFTTKTSVILCKDVWTLKTAEFYMSKGLTSELIKLLVTEQCLSESDGIEIEVDKFPTLITDFIEVKVNGQTYISRKFHVVRALD